MSDKIYPKGLRVFQKHDNAPDFVIGTIVISPNELFTWIKENAHLLSEYKDEKQLRLQLLSGNKGPYAIVDTYRASAQSQSNSRDKSDDLPF